MSIHVYMQGALEPIVLNEPFQATLTNLSASQRTGSTFFVGNTVDEELVAIHIPRVTHMIERADV